MNSAWSNLLKPSALSTVVNGLLAVAALVLSRVNTLHSFYTSFYIPQILNNARSILGQTFVSVAHFVFHGFANYLLLIDFWLVVGIFVFIFIRGLGVLFHELAEDFVERNYVWPGDADHNRPLISTLEKWTFWVTDSIVLVLYLIIALRAILRGLSDLLTTHSTGVVMILVFGLVYLICAWLALHIATILLRLLRFKIRFYKT